MKKDNLHNVKVTGFKTPENYFESFEAKLQARLAEEKIIQGIKSSGYTVPKDYFETFENKLSSKLEQNNDTPVITLKPKRTLYYIAGIAASFVLLFGLIFNAENRVSIDSIDTLAIESFLYQEDYSNDDFASLFNTNEISETDFIDVTISDETLNQYLDNIDTDDLILD